MPKFIPDFHFEKPANKLSSAWCMKAIDALWYNGHNTSLLEGKDVEEIENYARGEWDMKPFKKIFKSMKRQLEAAERDGKPDTLYTQVDTTGLDWKCLPLIPTKLNAAVSVIQKVPIEISCSANDPLALKKKEEDINFLKNKPKLEADLQDFASQMGIGEVNLGETKHSAIPYSDSPYGLDLTEADELDIFENIVYALSVEASYETALQEFHDIKNIQQIRLLETRDQYKFGVSVNRTFGSDVTGLPDIEYVYPDNVLTPKSLLPDFSDNTHRFITMKPTVLEMFNYFGSEICDLEQLEKIINGETGYCKCNQRTPVDAKTWHSFKVEMVYCEVKSVDYVNVMSKKGSKRGFAVASNNDKDDADWKCTDKIWGQNTYAFYWLKGTQYCFGIHRLDYTHRTRGREAYQNFSTNIYKSQEKSAVELAIGENKKAQVADIKLQHAILKSLPAGKYIDLRFLRGAISAFEDTDEKYGLNDLITLAFEQNIIIGDTEGFDSKNDLQAKPLQEIAGGLRSEVEGYLRIIINAKQAISDITGINDQLAGQGANPEGLVGMQKLLINSSLNALYYSVEAIREQYQKVFTHWANLIKDAVEAGGKRKQAIVNIVGAKKAKIIDGLDEVPLHNVGVKVEIKQREEERARFEQNLSIMKQKGMITTADEYMLMYIKNPKDKIALLSVKEKRWMKKEEERQAKAYEQQQALVAQQGQNQQAAIQAEGAMEKESIYAKGDVQAKIIQLAAELGLNKEQFLAMARASHQQQRIDGQVEKGVRLLETKNDITQQQAMI